MPASRLFVYGTLRRGSKNKFAKILAEQSEFIGTGKMRGRVYDLGSYPGAVASKRPGDWVYGELFRLLDPRKTFQRLDAYEGPDFSRTIVTILLDSGEQLDSWVYLYQGRRIPTV
jgi:gamma-glutamylcyclotransferase (GGCT)/AIG2-like uncharacterized protein YtfP